MSLDKVLGDPIGINYDHEGFIPTEGAEIFRRLRRFLFLCALLFHFSDCKWSKLVLDRHPIGNIPDMSEMNEMPKI